MKLNYIQGDVRQPIGDGVKIIMHSCNDVPAMGSGVAKALYEKWPQVRMSYFDWYMYPNRNSVKFGLGKVQIVPVAEDIYVANIIGQKGMISASNPHPVKYEALQEAFSKLAEIAKQYNATIHSPMLGARLGGGNWDTIEKLIIEELVNKGVYVTVYQI